MFSDKDTIDTLEEENNLILKQKTNKILELTNFLPMDNNKFSNIVSLYLMNLIYKDSLKSDYINKIKIQKNRIFTSKFPPKISIGDFINKIIKFTKTSQSTFILGLIYLDRFCKLNEYILNDYNVHRLFLSSILIARKYNEDNFHSNKFFSKVCGIGIKDLNKMEYNFLVDISFNLYIKNSVTKQFLEKLLNLTII